MSHDFLSLPQLNHINLSADKDPLEFFSRLLSSASPTITLTLRRQASHYSLTHPPSSPFTPHTPLLTLHVPLMISSLTHPLTPHLLPILLYLLPMLACMAPLLHVRTYVQVHASLLFPPSHPPPITSSPPHTPQIPMSDVSRTLPASFGYHPPLSPNYGRSASIPFTSAPRYSIHSLRMYMSMCTYSCTHTHGGLVGRASA